MFKKAQNGTIWPILNIPKKHVKKNKIPKYYKIKKFKLIY